MCVVSFLSPNDIMPYHKMTSSFRPLSAQALTIFSTLIAPDTVLLILASGLSYAYSWDSVATLVFLISLSIAYGAICVDPPTKKYQLVIAQAMTFIFDVLMCAVVVGVLEQIVEDVDRKNCVEWCKLVSLGLRCGFVL